MSLYSIKAKLPRGFRGDVGVSVPHEQGGAVGGHMGQVHIGQAERKKRIDTRGRYLSLKVNLLVGGTGVSSVPVPIT